MRTDAPNQVLSVFTVKLTANQSACPLLLSNGNLVKEENLVDGRHTTTWKDPFPKPRCSCNLDLSARLVFAAVILSDVSAANVAAIMHPTDVLTRVLAHFAWCSYLFALVAGDLGHIHDRFVTRSKRAVDLYIYSEHKNIGLRLSLLTQTQNAIASALIS